MEFNIPLLTLANLIYNAFYVPGTVVVLLLNRKLAYKYRTNRLQRLFYTAAMIVFGFIGSHIGAEAYNLFQGMRGRPKDNNRTVFGTIIVVLIVIFILVMLEKGIRALIRKRSGKPVPDVSLLDVYDMMEPGAMIMIMLTKFRCIWVGCCHGYPCDWGIYSPIDDIRVFPVQIVEALMTFSILIACHFITQTRFFRRGMALFLGVGMFAFGRFFLEYLMYYEPVDRTYLGIFTFYQCLCILIFAVCLGVVIVLYKLRPSDPLPKKPEPKPVDEASDVPAETEMMPEPQPVPRKKQEPPKQKKQQQVKRPRKKTVSQKKYSKDWQSTKKKYKKKKH